MTEPNHNPRHSAKLEEVMQADDEASTATPEQSNVAKRHPVSLMNKSSSWSNNSKSAINQSVDDNGHQESNDETKEKHKSSAAGILFTSSLLLRKKLEDPFTKVRNSAEKRVVRMEDINDDMKHVRRDEWLEQASLHFGVGSSVANNDPAATPAGLPPPSEVDANIKPPGTGALDTTELKNPRPPPDIPSKISLAAKGVLLPPPPRPSILPVPCSAKRKSVEELEDKCRRKAMMHPFQLLWLGNIAALKVMGFFLVTLETFITCGLTAGLTLFWHEKYKDDDTWSGGGLSFVLLAFAVTSPISAAIGMAFQRRERALIAIADYRSFSYHLYMAHCLWDWPEGKEMGREKAVKDHRVDWLEHCDAVLVQLVGISDELSRFLTLPTTSRSRHRMTRKGRQEAARTMEVAYYLIESMTTQRLTRLIKYSERLKQIGLPGGEISRIRQYERFLSDILEQLRMVKLYRTPQALRSFARIFTILLPPFYAPSYAQVARDTQSLGVGIAFGIITAVGLTALFESLQVLEDPFTAFLALDGIDAREEFEVLHFAQLTNARRMIFPGAPEFPAGRRRALTRWDQIDNKAHSVGVPPPQNHPAASTSPSVRSGITMDETDHAQNPPSSDAADAEFGPPIHEVVTSRESVFDEHRAQFPEDESGHKKQNRNHTRNVSFWSLELLAGGNNPSVHSAQTPPHQAQAQAPVGLPIYSPAPMGDDSTVTRRTAPSQQHRRRRTGTNNSLASV